MKQIEALQMAVEHLGFCAHHGDKRAKEAVPILERMIVANQKQRRQRADRCEEIKNSGDSYEDRRGK